MYLCFCDSLTLWNKSKVSELLQEMGCRHYWWVLLSRFKVLFVTKCFSLRIQINPFSSSVRGPEVCQPIVIFMLSSILACSLLGWLPMATIVSKFPACLFLLLLYLFQMCLPCYFFHLPFLWYIFLSSHTPPLLFSISLSNFRLLLPIQTPGGPVSWLHGEGHAGTHNHQWKTKKKEIWKNSTPPPIILSSLTQALTPCWLPHSLVYKSNLLYEYVASPDTFPEHAGFFYGL